MKKRILVACFATILMASCSSTKDTTNDLAKAVPIESFIDLTKIENDKAPVTINPGRFTKDVVTYHIPKTIPGTYQTDDYGQYIEGFKAYDYKGREMLVTKPDVNSWRIANAKQLDKITYLVNDTYDLEVKGGIGNDVPFSPSGTNIEPNNYILNLHGFIGYFDTLENNQYRLNVTAPIDFVRTSALQNVGSKTSTNGKSMTSSYLAQRYFDITDNPMMYGKLDVEEFQVDDVKVVLSVYSPNKVHSAKSLKDTFFKMMQAQKAFLGAINSTTRYDIFVYLSDMKAGAPMGFGALEHHTSTLVVMPEYYPEDALAESMIDIVSHEFFHILTPLTVHSEDVHDFNYNNPTYSKHLWMYEGVTEYFSNLFQVNQGLISEDDFFNRMKVKIDRSLKMNDSMSFTEMSEHVTEQPYKDQYGNVYEKGALIGMCVDILLRKESQGQRGLLSLMKELSNKYGKDKPFEDDALFDEIAVMTYPTVSEFLKTHVVEGIPIDYGDFFEKVGLIFGETKIETSYLLSHDKMIIGANPQYGTVFFMDAVKDNSFWNDLGARSGDIIQSIDGTNLTMQNVESVLQNVFSWDVGKEIEVKLIRKGELIEIKTKTVQSYTTVDGLHANPKATQEQINLREAWLKGQISS